VDFFFTKFKALCQCRECDCVIYYNYGTDEINEM
jgi:hypothetical protein